MQPTLQAIVLADGAVAPRVEIDEAWPGWCAPDPYVVAADGGARHAAALDLTIDLWVGDGDSLGEDGLAELAAAGVPIDRSPFDKDESDTELAVRAVLARRPAAITIVGALGGPRLDHALANLALLELPELRGLDVRIVAADARVRLLVAPAPDGGPSRLALEGRTGDHVSLLPVGGDASGVTTADLAFPLRDEPLLAGPSRGLSNRRTAPIASVTLRSGRLLVIETPARLSP
jgi:thiamine pyrophosphokinase